MTAPARVLVEADGGSRGNPGPAGYGAVVLDPQSREVFAERSESIGTDTNNVAEYRGLIAGLEAALELGAQHVDVRMDSKLVVEQMKGTWQVKNPALRELARTASALRSQFDAVTFEWIPRERNKHADRLANEAMDRATGRTPTRREPASGAPAVSEPTATQQHWAPSTEHRTRLVLVRHGATEHSAERRFSGRNDLPLDATGRVQAAALGRRPWGPVDAVVSSPLRRAVETAESIARPLGLGVETRDDLAETDFGRWEGRTFAEARADDPAALEAWLASPDAAPPGGESFAAVGRRVRRARDRLLAAHPATERDTAIVVVTHVTPIKSLLRLALEAPPSALFRIHLDTASVSVIDYFGDGANSVRLVNDTCHLRD